MASKSPSFVGRTPASLASSVCKSANVSQGTGPERILRRELWKSGLRFRKNITNLPGRPDIVFPKAKVAIFCDGDFWHGRDWRKLRAKLARGWNGGYWCKKIAANRARDRKNVRRLEQLGWRVIRMWESDIKRDIFGSAATIRQLVKTRSVIQDGEVPKFTRRPLRFVDLFAGLGGFHLALRRLGHKCVFACELDANLCSVYSANFGLVPARDIRKLNASDIPPHDILCAGFPCQPFSKAGSQNGFNCPQWGDLFEHVLEIIQHHYPHYLLLENVPNLEKHDNGRTWAEMLRMLEKQGYSVLYRRLSPHRLGIPQIRERFFIVASRAPLANFRWPPETSGKDLSILSALDRKPVDARPLTKQTTECLEAWQDLLKRLPVASDLPSFPIWSMEFGATYPYKHTTPHALGSKKLHRYRGSHGVRLSEMTQRRRLSSLPSYARTRQKRFPKWKVDFIRNNREFYKRHRRIIDQWVPKIMPFPASLQKFEWNCKGAKRDVWNLIIQFRASGVRVKRPTTAPSLIAMTTTQVPIIGWQRRYMIPQECARLQSMHELTQLPKTPNASFKALGNAVNVDLVELIARGLLPAVR